MARHTAYSACEADSFEATNVVLAILDQENFDAAQSWIRDLAAWRDVDDFVQERESAYFGYGTAGVSAHLQPVSCAGFERWTRLTGAPSDLPSLDLFAEHWYWRKRNPSSPIKGILRARPSSEPDLVGAGGVQRVAIFPEGFRCWRTTLARLPVF